MFDTAIQKVLANEGGYVNNPSDKGGETYKGIARNYHKEWGGWAIIDSYKSQSDIANTLNNNQELQTLVQEFYKNEYWNKLVSPLNVTSDKINDYIFDMCVNIGGFAKIIQRAINANIPASEQITVDGIIGSGSKHKLQEAISAVGEDKFLSSLVEYRVKYYCDIVANNTTQAIFLRGWINRSYEV